MATYFRSGITKNAKLRTLDIRPDDTDARDYVFQPTLTLLPETVDHRGLAPIHDQTTEGACVGFALAAAINVSLRLRHRDAAKRDDEAQFEPVSERMLYEMARRYDEWKGEAYEGTSLRGAMKGWHKHGVTTAALWPSAIPGKRKSVADRNFTPERATDALRRPIGAYYRILDSDASHLQAAVVEGDAVLASAWVHPGWRNEKLEDRGPDRLKRIPPDSRSAGLHAFAIVGYTPEGFIIQNSWGDDWGSAGYALLGYDDWFENRQDAWVARPAPTTLDSRGEPKLFLVGFAGGGESRAETTAAGLDIDPEAVHHIINTGDRGALSPAGLLATREDELPEMAQRVLMVPPLSDGCRHVVLYAHGGLNSETYSAGVAGRLWTFCRERDLAAYFFVWESGVSESILGWFKSTDDASGPTKFSFQDAWESIKKGAGSLVRKAQEELGAGLAPVARAVFWNEMKGRAKGASQHEGGASLFTRELFQTFARTPGDKYKIHLVAHSAGSIYLAWLYQIALREPLATAANVNLASIQFMAPAITINGAKEAFFSGGNWAVSKERFRVYMLKTKDEESDTIYIYPSSLLTYVADHLESEEKRVPVLGMRKDFVHQNITFATPVAAMDKTTRHGDFANQDHDIDGILTQISEGRF